jgi:putative membrane protein
VATEGEPFSHTRHEAAQSRRYSRFIFRAPRNEVGIAGIVIVALIGTLIIAPSGSSWVRFTELFLAIFLIPSLAAIPLTTWTAGALGGHFPLRRSALLALMCSVLPIPFLLVWRGIGLGYGGPWIGAAPVLLLAQGLVLWFRHMSLFGVSNPRHGATLPAALLQPVFGSLGTMAMLGFSWANGLAAILFLVLGFLCAALLLRAADRPLRREFNASGVSLIRPLLEHVGSRDPAATRSLEEFFGAFRVPANLRVTAIQFRGARGPVATLALPTVHPGPFAALGSSDLPRKLDELLGPGFGTTFVPHTPCNHDLDLPSEAEVQRVADAARALIQSLPQGERTRASPLVTPTPESWARAQLLGSALLIVVSQAPEPTDDIDFAIADRLFDENQQAGGPMMALIDAHNSYKEDEGDLVYGSPHAERLNSDVRAARSLALQQVAEGPVRVGAAIRTGYDVGRDGIGPQGIRALVVEAAGKRAAYVLIDGNNLVQGVRAPLLVALRGMVDAAEVMTTDNHVVHEVDGGTNPVGERYPFQQLQSDVQKVVREALGSLEPVEVRIGSCEVPDVPVLGPDWTARLLTALGDTLSMFSNAFLTTFLLLVSSSIVVLALVH